MSQAEHSFAYEFGEWLVEPDLNRIQRDGQEIQLEPRTSEVLRYLLEHPGETVSIDELLDTVWAGRIVENNAVHRNVNRIRRALDDDPRNPSYIETVTKRGYRTLAPIRRFEATPATQDLQTALEAVTPPYPAYDGEEPYTFVCYSHRNRELVYEELKRLRSAGINIWYDEGITPGAEWTEEVDNAITNCTHLLFFVSPASVGSSHCLNEIQLALELEKSLIVVYLEQTALPSGLRLQIIRRQALFKYEMPENEYARKLIRALSSSPGQASGPTRRPTAAPQDTPAPLPSTPSRFRKRAIAAAAAGALVVSVTMLVLRGPESVFREPVPENSIIVPPFRDLTTKHDAAQIGGTIQSDVRVALPAMGFQVVGSMYDGAEITETANAALLLTGSVNRGLGGSSIKVTIELFSTDNDHQIYANTYDVQGNDAAVVQSQIAQRVATDLARVVGEEQPALLANIPDETPATGTLQGILNQQPALSDFSSFEEPPSDAKPTQTFQSFESVDDFQDVNDLGGFEDVDGGFEDFGTFDSTNQEGGSDE